ncbi:MAG: hypothetical protein ABI411_12705 [Tahibacter sp.]
MTTDRRADYEEKLRSVAAATGYPRQTVAWVGAALSHGGTRTLATTGSRHFDARELCRILIADLMEIDRGSLRDALIHAGILSSRDIGRIVFALIEVDLATAGPGETEADFASIFETRAIDAFCARVGLRRRTSLAALQRSFGSTCYIAGFSMVMLNYGGFVSQRTGWIGWMIGMLGFVTFYIPTRRPARFGD